MLRVRYIVDAVLLGISMLLCSGCVVKVPLSPEAPNLQFGKKLPVEAALLIPEDARNYVFRGKPDTFAQSAGTFEIAFGEAMEKTSLGVFSQIFDKLTLVRTPEEARKYLLSIEPKIESYHFQFESAPFTRPTVYSKMSVHARVGGRDGVVKDMEESDESKGPQDKHGKIVSAQVVDLLGKIAIRITEDAAVRKLIESK